MRLLLDQGLPRSAVFHLDKLGIESTHAADVGLSTAPDSRILEHCRNNALVVVTLDADFHAQLALSRAAAPSVIRIRIEGLRGEDLAKADCSGPRNVRPRRATRRHDLGNGIRDQNQTQSLTPL